MCNINPSIIEGTLLSHYPSGNSVSPPHGRGYLDVVVARGNQSVFASQIINVLHAAHAQKGGSGSIDHVGKAGTTGLSDMNHSRTFRLWYPPTDDNWEEATIKVSLSDSEKLSDEIFAALFFFPQPNLREMEAGSEALENIFSFLRSPSSAPLSDGSSFSFSKTSSSSFD